MALISACPFLCRSLQGLLNSQAGSWSMFQLWSPEADPRAVGVAEEHAAHVLPSASSPNFLSRRCCLADWVAPDPLQELACHMTGQQAAITEPTLPAQTAYWGSQTAQDGHFWFVFTRSVLNCAGSQHHVPPGLSFPTRGCCYDGLMA